MTEDRGIPIHPTCALRQIALEWAAKCLALREFEEVERLLRVAEVLDHGHNDKREGDKKSRA